MSAAELREQLHAIGARAAVELRRRNFAACLRSQWLRTLRGLLVVPVVFVALDLVAGTSRRADLGWLGIAVALAVASFAATLAFVLVGALRAADRSLDERDGLARLERELASVGRLQAAHEFVAKDSPSAFEQAAIEDALPHVERARAHRLAPDVVAPWPKRAWAVPLAALALCALLATWVPTLRSHDAAFEAPEAFAVAPHGLEAPRARDAAARRDATPPARAKDGEPKPREAGAPSTGEERAAALEAEREARESVGKTGEGLSAQATPTSASSESRGFMSSQSPPSEPGEAGKPGSKKAKKPAKQEPTATPRKPLDEPSGATAGKGTGSGSSKNPGSTDWQSKDQVSSDEEAPLENEEDVDDESDESEARGGLQPSLRDRRPAVNRDLTIGFGNQLDPDANGRGGPSEQKKSRGVASLVLGVPLPDHVKGQPNPGRTKITQERVEPRAEDAAPISAAARAPRAQPIGSLNRRELEPWMRALVRGYFLKLRTKSESQP